MRHLRRGKRLGAFRVDSSTLKGRYDPHRERQDRHPVADRRTARPLPARVRPHQTIKDLLARLQSTSLFHAVEKAENPTQARSWCRLAGSQGEGSALIRTMLPGGRLDSIPKASSRAAPDRDNSTVIPFRLGDLGRLVHNRVEVMRFSGPGPIMVWCRRSPRHPCTQPGHCRQSASGYRVCSPSGMPCACSPLGGAANNLRSCAPSPSTSWEWGPWCSPPTVGSPPTAVSLSWPRLPNRGCWRRSHPSGSRWAIRSAC